jgi:hypothetical protein
MASTTATSSDSGLRDARSRGFCADVGSVRSGNFGWACASVTQGDVSAAGGPSPGDLVAAVAAQLGAGCPVALGFECPLFVPVPEAAARLGTARAGEGNRAWSAGAGSGAMATGLVQAAWILDAIHSRCSDATLHLDWESFADARSGLLLWEAGSPTVGSRWVGCHSRVRVPSLPYFTPHVLQGNR